jgi:hypothetical protein
MGDNEKIQREIDMLARDLHAMRDAHLIRIMRNKRLPLSERYAALMQYAGRFKLPDDSSDEYLSNELKLMIIVLDSAKL